MKVLIIGSFSDEQTETTALQKMASFIARSLETQSEDVLFCHIDELGYVASHAKTEIYDYRNKNSIEDYDLVLFRGKLRAGINDVALVSWFLQERSIKTLNSAYVNRRSTGKVPQMYQLQSLGLPIPYSVSAGAAHLPELICDHLTYPVIVKDMHGGHGNDNHLVRNEDELRKVLSESSNIRFIAQEFIPNDMDYRILIVGSKELIICRKGVDGSHLNNTSQGGSAILVDSKDFSQEIIKQARKYAEYCQYEIAGVDVIIDSKTGKHYFLEINSQPQIASGAFVDEKAKIIGEYFKETLQANQQA